MFLRIGEVGGKSEVKKEQNECLEALSDKVRCGEPVSFQQALRVIEYQERLRAEREKRLWYRIKMWAREGWFRILWKCS